CRSARAAGIDQGGGNRWGGGHGQAREEQVAAGVDERGAAQVVQALQSRHGGGVAPGQTPQGVSGAQQGRRLGRPGARGGDRSDGRRVRAVRLRAGGAGTARGGGLSSRRPGSGGGGRGAVGVERYGQSAQRQDQGADQERQPGADQAGDTPWDARRGWGQFFRAGASRSPARRVRH